MQPAQPVLAGEMGRGLGRRSVELGDKGEAAAREDDAEFSVQGAKRKAPAHRRPCGVGHAGKQYIVEGRPGCIHVGAELQGGKGTVWGLPKKPVRVWPAACWRTACTARHAALHRQNRTPPSPQRLLTRCCTAKTAVQGVAAHSGGSGLPAVPSTTVTMCNSSGQTAPALGIKGGAQPSRQASCKNACPASWGKGDHCCNIRAWPGCTAAAQAAKLSWLLSAVHGSGHGKRSSTAPSTMCSHTECLQMAVEKGAPRRLQQTRCLSQLCTLTMRNRALPEGCLAN